MNERTFGGAARLLAPCCAASSSLSLSDRLAGGCSGTRWEGVYITIFYHILDPDPGSKRNASQTA
eukprot:scaffold129607_cov28-Tisochrysis_lutea.AAC.2